MTTGTGAPVGNKLASMTIGPRGPILLQDFVFTDEMAHFNRERIPERVVHAKGAGRLKLQSNHHSCHMLEVLHLALLSETAIKSP